MKIKSTSRRHFMAVASSAAVAWVGGCSKHFANAQAPADNLSPEVPTEKPRIYERGEIPRIDIHSHIDFDDLSHTGKLIEAMDAGRIAVSVNLSGTPEMLKQAESIREKWNARILICPMDSVMEDGLWWTEADLETFKEKRCAGTKIWSKYQQGVLTPEFVKKVGRQGELGLPAIGFHISDPPEGDFWKPNYWDCIWEAEKLIARCPQTTFIMAHGFWLMNEDRGLDVLADFFDRYDNLNVDLSAVDQWWHPPEPSYKKLRDFMIHYKDRILFGTDGNPNYTTPELLMNSFRVLESDEDQLHAFFNQESRLRGLNLPTEVLNYIYYGNAVRLVPEVRQSMLQLGYKLS